MKLFNETYYHGSPSDFDKFDLSFLSSGVGDQVWGWGIYVAKDRRTSDNYNKAFDYHKTDWNTITFGGHTYKLESFTDLFSNNIWSVDGVSLGGFYDEENDEWIDYEGEYDADEVNKTLDFLREMKYDKSVIEDCYHEDYDVDWGLVQEFLDDNTEQEGKYHSTLYALDIPDDTLLLDDTKKVSEWDSRLFSATSNVYKKFFSELIPQIEEFTPLSRKSKMIEACKKYERIGLEHVIEVQPDICGFELYKHFCGLIHIGLSGPLTKELEERYKELQIHVGDKGAKQDTSLFLSRNGIKGLSYYGHKDGYCAVIYDPEIITIVSKEKTK